MAEDTKLDKVVLKRARELRKRYPYASPDGDDIAQRVRLRLHSAREKYSALAPEEWIKVAYTVIRNELARCAKRLERENSLRKLETSRDCGGETDPDGEYWRDNLDWRREMELFDAGRLRRDIAEAIGRMSGPERIIIEEYYRGKGLRTIAKERGRPFSSFQSKEWARAKSQFAKYF